jgi:predicted DNA-binding protein YlxM (UPF0122 family)
MSNNDTADSKSDDCIDHTDAETLRRLYWDEGLSMPEIAERSDVKYHSTILHWMEKHGIERREKVPASIEKRRVEYANLRLGKKGHPRWETKYDGGSDTLFVHRLIAVSEWGYESVASNDVHHKNGIPWDNRPENLKIVGHAEHTSIHSAGENNPNAKLDKSDVKEIRERYECTDMTQRELGDRFGVSQSAVYNIVTGDYWGSD